MKYTLIKNGQIATGTDSFRGDVLIHGGKIKALADHIEKPDAATEVIDASGLLVFPGAIDPHVHMELPVAGTFSSDDFESGTIAALAGGTTTIIDFVTPERNQSLLQSLQERKEVAGKAVCDYGLHMSITRWDERVKAEMQQCVQSEGITSFKVYLAYKETIGLEDRELIAAMDWAARIDGLIVAHCEHGDAISYLQRRLLAEGKTEPRYHAASRPAEVEREAVVRAMTLAKITGASLYIVHVSTEDAVQEIAQARAAGQTVLAETCPHYLLLDEREYDRPLREAAAYIMSPPLRPPQHKGALWHGLASGYMQTVATDHCPFNLNGQKDRDLSDFTRIPNGVAGVENRLQLLYTYGVLENRISLNQFVRLVATGPAKIFGLYPRKGSLTVGADADIVLWNPESKSIISAKTHRQKCDTSIYEGFQVKGKPEIVIANGKIAFKDDQVLAHRGEGNYLLRAKTSDLT